MQTAMTETAAMVHDGFTRAMPLDTQKRIGSTVYITLVHTRVKNPNFNNSTAETIEEKILRLARNDLNAAQDYVKLKYAKSRYARLLTGRLSEGGLQ